MATYVLLAHQTALSEALAGAPRSFARRDPAAEFVVLVPATSVGHLLTSEEGETPRWRAVGPTRPAIGSRRGGCAWSRRRSGTRTRAGAQRPAPRRRAGVRRARPVHPAPGHLALAQAGRGERVRTAYPTLRLVHVVGAAAGVPRPPHPDDAVAGGSPRLLSSPSRPLALRHPQGPGPGAPLPSSSRSPHRAGCVSVSFAPGSGSRRREKRDSKRGRRRATAPSSVSRGVPGGGRAR